MKKILIITGSMLTIFYGVLSYGIMAHSDEPSPSDSVNASKCSTESGEIDACCTDYHDAMDAAEADWDETLQSIIDQEKPMSEVVGEAYESMRTYNCWLEYICKAVEFSGYAPIESTIPKDGSLGIKLTSEHIGIVPGCQAPEDMEMGKAWNGIINTMEKIPIIGIGIPGVISIQAIDEYYWDTNKINMFPRCMTSARNNESPNLPIVARNYRECKQALELKFSYASKDSKGNTILDTEGSNAFAKVDNVLKKASADQKASALENKLGEIVPKLQMMETHVGYVSNFLQQLNNRLQCFAAKCT